MRNEGGFVECQVGYGITKETDKEITYPPRLFPGTCWWHSVWDEDRGQSQKVPRVWLFYISPVTKRSEARLAKQKALQTEDSEARGGVACWKEELSFGVTRFFRAMRSCPLIVGRKRSSGDSIVGDH